jgi:hypothetical protein
MDTDMKRLREKQAESVMPLIGALLDAFDGLPNDIVTMDEMYSLANIISKIADRMENTNGH